MIPLSIEIADINEAMKRPRVNELENLFSGCVIAITQLRSNVKLRGGYPKTKKHFSIVRNGILCVQLMATLFAKVGVILKLPKFNS